jgi:hypothetical protein
MEENLSFYRLRSPIPDGGEYEFAYKNSDSPPSSIGDLSLQELRFSSIRYCWFEPIKTQILLHQVLVI